MRSHVRAVVVGGGAVGTAIAYHLAKAGWTDTVLLERDELTSGSTWHAAGLLPLFNMGYATSHIHDYSVKHYKTLEAETGLNAGFAVVGNLRMAQTRARMDEYQLYASTAESVGIPYEWLTPAGIKDRWPLVRTDDLIGALFHPTDGYINPADVTQAMAKGARQTGVEIVRRAQVDSYFWTGSEWVVRGHVMVERGGNLVALRGDLRDHRPARRHRHRQPRPAHGAPPRHQDPGDPGRAPVHRHRARPRPRRLPQGARRAPRPPRRRRQVVCPRGARRLDPRPLRGGRPRPLRVRRARQLPRRPLPARSRAHRDRVPVDDPPHPVVGDRRPQGRLQRPDLLHPRRQPPRRPGAGPAQPVAGGGLLLRHHRRRRRRPLPRPDDGRAARPRSTWPRSTPGASARG